MRELHRDLQRVQPCLLEREVERGDEAVACRRRRAAKHAPGRHTGGVDLDPFDAVATAQVPVIGVLEATLADHVAGRHAGEVLVGLLGSAEIADVAEDLRRERPARVVSDIGLLFDETRERGLVLGQEDERRARDVSFERDWSETVAATHGLRDLALGEVQHLPHAAVKARARGRCRRQLLADDRRDRGRVDVRDHAPLAIDDLSARCRDRDVARTFALASRTLR